MSTLAAQYLRMSTEHQQYSLVNQSAAISEYANAHNFEIVATYSDEARSGLTITERPGLRRLIEDITLGRAVFAAVLVLDVSRWGRFQDADEAAHYEFLCKLGGIKVLYCAECFSNVEGLSANLLKALKRSMAAEYSKELSGKVFAGQCRLVRNGFKVGGTAGYGLRRLLLDQHGHPKTILQHGEQKSLTTERVIYALGSEEEQQVIRSIYSMFLDQNMSMAAIARQLNALGVPRDVDKPWITENVNRILTHPKYVGSIVFNRSSSRLHTRKVRNESDQWVSHPERFPAIVSHETFQRVQEKLRNRAHYRSDKQLMDELRAFLKKNGRLSTKLICPANGLACYTVYKKRFGPMKKVYDLVPYRLSRTFVPACEAKFSLRLRAEIHNNFMDELVAQNLSFAVSGYRVTLFDQGTFSLEVGRCVRTECTNSLRWRVWCRKGSEQCPCLVVRMNPDNRTVRDCCLLPSIPTFKWRFSISDDVVRRSAITRTTTMEMAELLGKQGANWLSTWSRKDI